MQDHRISSDNERKFFVEFLFNKIQNHYCGKNINNLTISYTDNFIILNGKISSYYLKQIVQELISKDVFLVNLGLDNQIEVEYRNSE